MHIKYKRVFLYASALEAGEPTIFMFWLEGLQQVCINLRSSLFQ